MKNSILVAINGPPAAQPRARTGKYGNFYTPSKRIQVWKEYIAVALMDKIPEKPWEGPISVSMSFYMQRPKRMLKKMSPDGELWHTQKPDIDNLEKAVLDVCTTQGVWVDDCQVCYTSIRKYWMTKDGSPGMFLAIRPMEEQEELDEDEVVVWVSGGGG